MPKILKLAVSQSRTLATTAETLDALAATAKAAAAQGIDLILFPEAYIGGYPRGCTFGGSVGIRTAHGRDQFLAYFQDAVDLGDTPTGGGDDWVERRLPIGKGKQYRGDGTREFLETVARDTGVFFATGLIEKSGGSLYCAVVYVCPREGVLGKRRKVMPTGSERLVWAQGAASTLRAVATTIKGVQLTLAAAICWENAMPLLRQSLYSQNVNLYLAPTADARPTWLPLMQTIAFEGRCVVLSANQCVRKKHLPKWITDPPKGSGSTATASVNGLPDKSSSSSKPEGDRDSKALALDEKPGNDDDVAAPMAPENGVSESSELQPKKQAPGKKASPNAPSSETPKSSLPPAEDINSHAFWADNPHGKGEFICRGGSCIIDPIRSTLAGPLWEVEDGGILTAEVDFEDCERGRLDLDVAGSYSRNDAFKLSVVGLDIDPLP